MRKNLLKTFCLTAALAAGMTAQAQTDVTSQYIQNADFSQGTPVTVGICTYAKDMEQNGTEYSQMVAVDGWEFGVENGDARASGIFTPGSGVWLGGNTYSCPDVDADGGSSNLLGLCGVWTGTAQYVQQCSLPAGSYTLSVSVLNTAGTSALAKNLIGFIDANGSEYFAATKSFPVGEWTTESATIILTESATVTISLGITAQNVGSGSAQHLFLDNLTLTWSDPLSASKEALQEEINKATTLATLYQAADANALSALNQAISSATAALNATTAEELSSALDALKAAEAEFMVNIRYPYDGVAYIIDAESGLMVAAGHDWGTRGIVNEVGLDLTFAANEDNTVTIDTQVSNGGDSHFLGSNLYTDAAAYNWSLVYVGFGFYITNGTQFLNIDADNNLVFSDTPREWIIVTADGVYEERLGEMAEATNDNPVDATFLLKNPNFNRNDQRVNFWTVSDDCTNKNLNGGNNFNNCAESYHSVFTISQTVEGAPAGIYEMTAQGFYREDPIDEVITTIDLPVFFANNETAAIPERTGEENSMSLASESFTNGEYTIAPIRFTVAQGESITIGARLEYSTNLWCIFDNFTLKYFGSGSTDGITTVESTKQPANAIYTLAGQRVNNAQKGIYITNGKKVVMK